MEMTMIIVIHQQEEIDFKNDLLSFFSFFTLKKYDNIVKWLLKLPYSQAVRQWTLTPLRVSSNLTRAANLLIIFLI